jgi:hypothetical protein
MQYRHGQWDYGNKWSLEGCKGGNCLRSHVDFMETYNTLAMITKAGVPTDKITVGIASYGRQFKMTDPSCTGKDCTFTGPQSTATPGRCTEVPEYISLAEIKEILQKNPSAKAYEGGSGGGSHYMTYDGNWVSYMDDKDKVQRTNTYKGLKFGGIVEWAIDLNSFEFDGKNNDGPGGPQDPFSVSKGGDNGLRRGGGGQRGGFADGCNKDDSWLSVSCTADSIVDTNQPAKQQWSGVKADAAWCAAVKEWNSKPSGGKAFPVVVSDFLRGPRQFACQDLVTKNSCDAPQTCEDRQKGGTGAARQLVLTAMANINAVSLGHL